MRSLIFLFTLSAFGANPKPQPIAPEDTAIVQGLVAGLQTHQQQVNAAVAKQEARICKEHKIKRDVCFVDWAHGTVGPKPKPAETPAK